jgi:hypothetical protein
MPEREALGAAGAGVGEDGIADQVLVFLPGLFVRWRVLQGEDAQGGEQCTDIQALADHRAEGNDWPRFPSPDTEEERALGI